MSIKSRTDPLTADFFIRFLLKTFSPFSAHMQRRISPAAANLAPPRVNGANPRNATPMK